MRLEQITISREAARMAAEALEKLATKERRESRSRKWAGIEFAASRRRKRERADALDAEAAAIRRDLFRQ